MAYFYLNWLSGSLRRVVTQDINRLTSLMSLVCRFLNKNGLWVKSRNFSIKLKRDFDYSKTGGLGPMLLGESCWKLDPVFP